MAVNTQTITASSIGADAGNSFFIYWDNPVCSGSVNVYTGSSPGVPLTFTSQSLLDGTDVDFPPDAINAFIKVNPTISGSNQYCNQCFGPVVIPGAATPTPPPLSNTPTPTPTATPTATPAPEMTPTPTPIQRSIRLHESPTANNTTEVCAEIPSYRRYFISIGATIQTGLVLYTDAGLTTPFSPAGSTTFAQLDDVDNLTVYGVDFAGNGSLGNNVDECTI